MANDIWVPVASLSSHLEAESLAARLRDEGVIAKSDDAVEDLAASTIADFFRVLVPESQEQLAIRTMSRLAGHVSAIDAPLVDPELRLEQIRHKAQQRIMAIVILFGIVVLVAAVIAASWDAS